MSIFTALKFLCVLSTFCPPHSNSWQPMIFFTIYSFVFFRISYMYFQVFSSWLLSLGNMSLRSPMSFCGMIAYFSWVLNNIPFSESTTSYLSIYSQRRYKESLAMLCLAPFYPRKAIAGHAHSGRSLLWCIAKSCDQVICPLLEPLSPAVEWLFSGSQWAFYPWRSKIGSSKCSPGRRVISLSATQEVPSACCVDPKWCCLSHSLPLSQTLLHETCSLSFVAPGLFSSPVHGYKPCICHIISFQLCKLFS